MAEPSFSVVIPTYNRAHLVMRTIDSVLNQTRAAHEIIVVDNCSTDETMEVLRPLAEAEQIIFVRHPHDLGRAASRNTGLSRATGDFVTFLDSDDLMYPENLAAATDFTRARPTTDIFHNLYEHIHSDGTLIRRGRFPSLRDARARIADGNFMSCIGNFVRREVYAELRFDTDPELDGSEDWLFWIRAFALCAEVGRIDSFNSGHVHHPGQTTKEIDLGRMRRRLDKVVGTVRDDDRLAGAYGPYMSRLEVGTRLLLASAANSIGEHALAARCLIDAAKIRPASAASERYARIAWNCLSRSGHG